MEPEPQVHSFFERSTNTWAFIVADSTTKRAVIIDPVLDAAIENRISTTAADSILALVSRNEYVVERILETHGGSQKSAAFYLRTQLQQRTGSQPRVSMGKSFAGVQRMFARKYGIQDIGWQGSMDTDFKDGQVIEVGEVRVHVLQLPSGTKSDHVGFLTGGNIFVGDPALTGDLGSAKIDFEDESAHVLWTSIQRLLSLPTGFRIYASQHSKQLSGEAKAFVSVEDLRAKCKSLAMN